MKQQDSRQRTSALEERLNDLPNIARQSLAGLEASEHLFLRIQRAAEQPAEPCVRRSTMRQLIPVCALALVVAISAVLGIPALLGTTPPEQPIIHAQPAGSDAPTAMLADHTLSLLDLRNQNVTIGAQSNAPKYRSIWASGTNGTFPLIGVNGRYYRMLSTPGSVNSRLLGSSVGTVAEFTTEPSLSGTNVILSNQASIGTKVYEVSGMGGTLIAAEVNGKMRAFQRVSFNGSALKGNEDLADTLQLSGHITAMELSNVGIITDANTCQKLFRTLINNASYQSSGSISGNQSLLLELDNGLTVQLAVKNDKLAACGTWSCPEFFEAFEDALQ